jgi:hypothetical protein
MIDFADQDGEIYPDIDQFASVFSSEMLASFVVLAIRVSQYHRCYRSPIKT